LCGAIGRTVLPRSAPSTRHLPAERHGRSNRAQGAHRRALLPRSGAEATGRARHLTSEVGVATGRTQGAGRLTRGQGGGAHLTRRACTHTGQAAIRSSVTWAALNRSVGRRERSYRAGGARGCPDHRARLARLARSASRRARLALRATCGTVRARRAAGAIGVLAGRARSALEGVRQSSPAARRTWRAGDAARDLPVTAGDT
jgi:hypothetical protein